MRRIMTFVGGGYETKNEWNTMSMINKTTIQYIFKKIECMFLNVPSHKLQCSTYRNFSWNAKIFPEISSIFRKYYIFSGHIVYFSVQHTKILP